MNKQKLKTKALNALGFLFVFVLTGLTLPYFVEYILPSCFSTRIGCMGEPVLLLILIKVVPILLAAGTLYLAMKYPPGIAGRRST